MEVYIVQGYWKGGNEPIVDYKIAVGTEEEVAAAESWERDDEMFFYLTTGEQVEGDHGEFIITKAEKEV